jgi:acetyl-CoA carboxylase carboxyltransferase component
MSEINKKKIEKLHEKLNKLYQAGGEKYIQKQHEKGKLTARERILAFFDKNSFNEINTFAKHRCTNFNLQDKEFASDGVITGFGTVDSRLVYAFFQDFTVSGGSAGEIHEKKICDAMDLALKVGVPFVGFNDSGGARIQEGVDSLSGYGKIFYRNSKASGVIPQISVIAGPCAGGAAYSPGLTDFIIMIKNSSKMFIAGPDVIKAVTGTEISQEALGGAIVHNTRSGNAHFIAEDEKDCINILKKLLSFLPSNYLEKPKNIEKDIDLKDIDLLNEILPDDSNKSYDIKNIIFALVDNNDFFEVQEHFAKSIVIGFARINGNVVGIVANQPNFIAGVLDIDSSDKASRFVRFCDAFNIPLINLIDVPGFLPGVDQEFGGIIRHGAKMLFAYSEATVPKISIIIRKAYGGSYLAMCSKDLGADIVYAWPTAEIAVMGPEGAANILFRKEIEKSDDKKKAVASFVNDYRENFANPYIAAERGYVDSVIDPKETRKYIGMALEMLKNKAEVAQKKKHNTMPL